MVIICRLRIAQGYYFGQTIAANVHKISRNHNTCTFETNQHKIQEIIEKIEEAKRRNPMKRRWNEFEKLIKKLESFRDVSY